MIPPVNATTSSAAYSAAAQQAQSTANSQASSAPPPDRHQQQRDQVIGRAARNQETEPRNGRTNEQIVGRGERTRVAVLTADPEFEQSLRATFGTSGQIELRVVSGSMLDRRSISSPATSP